MKDYEMSDRMRFSNLICLWLFHEYHWYYWPLFPSSKIIINYVVEGIIPEFDYINRVTRSDAEMKVMIHAARYGHPFFLFIEMSWPWP